MPTFLLLCAVLVVLSIPFIPLMREWIRRSDVAALPIPDGEFDDPGVAGLACLRHLRETARGGPRDEAQARRVQRAMPWLEQGLDVRTREQISVPRGEVSGEVLYAARSINVGEGASASYAFAERKIRLNTGARLSSVAYAPRIDAHDAILDGAVNARALHLRGDCRFARLGGASIVMGKGPGQPHARKGTALREVVAMSVIVGDLPHRGGDTRFRVRGDLRIPGHVESEADLVVDGAFYLGEASVLQGSVKAYSVELAADAVVRGAVFARHDIVLGEMSRVEGVLSAGQTLHMHRASIGKRGHRVSACAADIVVWGGACVHGELIAIDSGQFSESAC